MSTDPRYPINQSVLQLDISRTGPNFFTLPKHLPGRVNVDDFVYFNLPPGMVASQFMVAIDSLDTAGPSFKTIGKLSQSGGSVELPHVHLPAYGNIYVMPANNPALPTFWARLNRGSTYTIPDVRRNHVFGMRHVMQRHGILTAGCDSSSLAY